MGWDSGDGVVGMEMVGEDDGDGEMKVGICNGMEAWE